VVEKIKARMINIFINKIKENYSFNIKYKNKSALMKLLGVLLFFNKEFMTKYITTIGSTIYFPNEEFIVNNPRTSINVLAHELVHVKQAQKYGSVIFGLLYLFPQCLVLFTLLTPLSLWFLCFLIFLLPFPAPWRAYFEIGGYTMSLFVMNLRLQLNNSSPDYIAEALKTEASNIDRKHFRGSAYWFMWPFGVMNKLRIKDIQDGVISKEDEIYNCVRQVYPSS
jgi:hypothetical protein